MFYRVAIVAADFFDRNPTRFAIANKARLNPLAEEYNDIPMEWLPKRVLVGAA